MKSIVVGARMPLQADVDAAAPSILTPKLKGTLQFFWQHRSMRFIREYYSGLGSCLLYHRISPEKIHRTEFSPYNGLTVTKERFEEQMEFLSRNFNVLSLPEAIQRLKMGSLPRKSVIITFDDGYRDNLLSALPILEKYQLPATVYVASGLVDRTAELWWFEQKFIVTNCSSIRYNWKETEYHLDLASSTAKYTAIEQLNRIFKLLTLSEQRAMMRELRAQCPLRYSYDDEILSLEELIKLDRHPLITIGAHTTNHPVLSRLESSELLSELNLSKHRLEEMLGHEISHFAYPFGGKDEVGVRESQAAESCHFESAVTTRLGHLYPQHNKFLFNLPRISVNYDDTVESLSWKLSGINSILRERGKRILAS